MSIQFCFDNNGIASNYLREYSFNYTYQLKLLSNPSYYKCKHYDVNSLSSNDGSHPSNVGRSASISYGSPANNVESIFL